MQPTPLCHDERNIREKTKCPTLQAARNPIKAGAGDTFWDSIGKTAADFPALTWTNFLGNLMPVTIGNIIGGSLLVGVVYWFVYLRRPEQQ